MILFVVSIARIFITLVYFLGIPKPDIRVAHDLYFRCLRVIKVSSRLCLDNDLIETHQIAKLCLSRKCT